MKNVVRVSVLSLAAILALSALASCTMPEYQLSFEISPDSYVDDAGNYAVVYYTLQNIGDKDLSNAMIRIEVEALDGSGGQVFAESWTSGHDLTAYSDPVSSSTIVYFADASSYVNAIVTGSAWDTDDSSGGFFF